jgi:hypothetical protein
MFAIAWSGAALSTVIARLDRAIQYSEASAIDPRKPGVLDPRFRGDDSAYEAMVAQD